MRTVLRSKFPANREKYREFKRILICFLRGRDGRRQILCRLWSLEAIENENRTGNYQARIRELSRDIREFSAGIREFPRGHSFADRFVRFRIG